METKNEFLVVKDEEGIYRPLAGMWVDYGRMKGLSKLEIDKFLKKNKDSKVVRVKFTEIK